MGIAQLAMFDDTEGYHIASWHILLCTDLKTSPCTCFWTWADSHWWLSVFWTCSVFSVFSHLCFPIFVFVVCLHAFSSRAHITMLTCQCKKAFKHLPRFRSCHVHRGECGREPGVEKTRRRYPQTFIVELEMFLGFSNFRVHVPNPVPFLKTYPQMNQMNHVPERSTINLANLVIKKLMVMASYGFGASHGHLYQWLFNNLLMFSTNCCF